MLPLMKLNHALALKRLLFAGSLLTSAVGASEAAWRLTPEQKPLQLTGFTGSLDLSGVARAGNTILVASDELTEVQTGTLDEAGRAIRCAAVLSLATADLPSEEGEKKKKKDGGKKKKAGEIDIEGVCFSAEENVFYVTGSHGVGKKKGDFQPARYGVYRIPLDPASGSVLAAQATRSSLLPWLETSAEFKDHVRQPLQQNGFNIEGIACKDGRLYFGVRGPNIDGKSYIIEAGAEELFRNEGRDVQPKVHAIPAGAGRGVREIVSVSGGFLIITGNAAAEPVKLFPQSIARGEDTGFALSFLPSSAPGQIGAPQLIGDISAPGGKAEGLLVLRDHDNALELLVLHDGLEQGGATQFTLRRPAKQVAVRGKE
jgi:hypothetical protein